MSNLINGDCLTVMRGMADNSVDSIVTDPPYGLSFMGKKWDHNVPSVEIWAECLRVLKPGGHLLSFGGSRTYHRLTCAIEDAGFEIRDQIMWVYGSGFPKSHNLTGDWQGWGTALKPAHEPICVARKPLVGTVAANVLAHGTGALNIDGCRVGTVAANVLAHGTGALNIDGCRVGTEGGTTRSGQAPYAESGWRTGHEVVALNAGRWPANVIHDGSDEVLAGFPDRPGATSNSTGKSTWFAGQPTETALGYGDTGSAARFFYCAKASKPDRDEGNNHPTVKPTDLMRYLCRLVTPPGGVVLDPFMGSGSTGKAAKLEGFGFVGIELDENYVEIARARIG